MDNESTYGMDEYPECGLSTGIFTGFLRKGRFGERFCVIFLDWMGKRGDH